MREVGTQTGSVDRVKTYEEHLVQTENHWREEEYKNTEIEEGNPLDIEGEMVKVVLVGPKEIKMESNIQGAYSRRYPELVSIKENFGIIDQEYKIRVKGEVQPKIRRTKIIKMVFDGREEDLFVKLLELKEETEMDKLVVMHEVDGMSVENLRKMVEGVFHETGTQVKIYTKLGTNTRKQVRERKTYALMVGNKDKTYNETLSQVKNSLKDEQNVGKVIGMRSTREGKLLIVMEKDDEAVEKLERLLQEKKDENTTVKRMTGGVKDTEAIHIRGLDALATREDVLKALKEKIPNLEKQGYKLSNLRPMAGDTQAATFSADKEVVKGIVEERNLRVGMVRCLIERRVEMDRCFRCWEYGHVSRSCEGMDRAGLCYRCGMRGHVSRDCTNKEKCPICDEEGHRAGTNKCKLFKQALQTAKTKERKKDLIVR